MDVRNASIAMACSLYENFRRTGSALGLMALLGLSLSACSPYSSHFKCPPSYGGVCESTQDAYYDSKHGIDPRKFDKKWQKKHKKWQKKHAKLLKARKEAKEAQARTGDAPEYRASLFKELRGLISDSRTPVVIPPKIGRALILGYTDRKELIAPHYVYFMLDEPRWVLQKIPERR